MYTYRNRQRDYDEQRMNKHTNKQRRGQTNKQTNKISAIQCSIHVLKWFVIANKA